MAILNSTIRGSVYLNTSDFNDILNSLFEFKIPRKQAGSQKDSIRLGTSSFFLKKIHLCVRAHASLVFTFILEEDF